MSRNFPSRFTRHKSYVERDEDTIDIVVETELWYDGPENGWCIRRMEVTNEKTGAVVELTEDEMLRERETAFDKASHGDFSE